MYLNKNIDYIKGFIDGFEKAKCFLQQFINIMYSFIYPYIYLLYLSIQSERHSTVRICSKTRTNFENIIGFLKL